MYPMMNLKENLQWNLKQSCLDGRKQGRIRVTKGLYPRLFPFNPIPWLALRGPGSLCTDLTQQTVV